MFYRNASMVAETHKLNTQVKVEEPAVHIPLQILYSEGKLFISLLKKHFSCSDNNNVFTVN